jgi:hypothetical protein
VEPALLSARPRARCGLHVVHGGQGRLRLFQEGLAGLGERYAPWMALEAGRVSTWGGANPVGSRFLQRAGAYQAWVRAQCGQPTEVVTSASKA